jgi:hypothetical protein
MSTWLAPLGAVELIATFEPAATKALAGAPVIQLFKFDAVDTGMTPLAGVVWPMSVCDTVCVPVQVFVEFGNTATVATPVPVLVTVLDMPVMAAMLVLVVVAVAVLVPVPER